MNSKLAPQHKINFSNTSIPLDLNKTSGTPPPLDLSKTSGTSPPISLDQEISQKARSISIANCKACTTCAQVKPVSNFYEKRNRHESICKSCKKEKRKKAIGSSPAKPHLTHQLEVATITRENVGRPKDPYIEPKTSSTRKENPISYDHWEKRYGRPLSDLEKMEILTNFTAFFKLLKDETNE